MKVRKDEMDVLMSNTSLSDADRLCLTGLKIALIVQVPDCALCVGASEALWGVSIPDRNLVCGDESQSGW